MQVLTNNQKFTAWLLIGVSGYLLNNFIIRPIVSTLPSYYPFTWNLGYSLAKLFVAEMLLLPTLIVILIALQDSLRNKELVWSIVHAAGLVVLAILAVYFAGPALTLAHGL